MMKKDLELALLVLQKEKLEIELQFAEELNEREQIEERLRDELLQERKKVLALEVENVNQAEIINALREQVEKLKVCRLEEQIEGRPSSRTPRSMRGRHH